MAEIAWRRASSLVVAKGMRPSASYIVQFEREKEDVAVETRESDIPQLEPPWMNREVGYIKEMMRI